MCGKMVKYISNKEEWNALVRQHAEKNGWLVVCFSATWCAPCKALAPKFTEIAQQYQDESVVFAKVDIEECPYIAEKFNVASVPCTMFIHKCKVIKSIGGCDILGIQTFLQQKSEIEKN
jgi:thioredoxin 1